MSLLSPREWGCFQVLWIGNDVASVFPTRVGVLFVEKIFHFPHVSGVLFVRYRVAEELQRAVEVEIFCHGAVF